MDQGNEGDEILFYSLRQSLSTFYDFPIIPASVDSVGLITPDILVEIVIRTLQIVTQNEEELPVKLPQNIAARHRICTFIAKTVKDNGFIGDCGYNQLLYPVENQTRNLLNWVVEKLPKLDEGQAEEDLGSNALLNRRLKAALAAWSSTPLSSTPEDARRMGIESVSSNWNVPFCTSSRGKRHRFFRTVPYILAKVTTSTKDPVSGSNVDSTRMCVSTSEVFRQCRDHQHTSESQLSAPSVGSCILEKHALELADDALYTLDLEGSYDGQSSASYRGKRELGATNTSNEEKGVSAVVQAAVRNEIMHSGGRNIVGVGSFTDAASTAAHKAYFNGTLQELLGTIAADHVGVADNTENKESRFAHAMQFAQESVASASSSSALSGSLAELSVSTQDSKEQQEKDNEARRVELHELKQQVLACSEAAEQSLITKEEGTAKIVQIENELKELNQQASVMENTILMKKKTLEMLPTATESIEKLQAVSAANKAKLIELETEWESHRGPLMEDHSQKVNERDHKREKCRSLVENMKELKLEMTAMVVNLREKQDRAKVLEEELGKLPKGLHRSTYIHRIMEITASIMKQEEGIDKITADIIYIQKTINRSRSAVQRADAITEELIYSAANDKNDSVMVDTYRNLRNLRSKFEDLLEAVDRLGQQNKQERILSTKIDQERSRVSANNLDRIEADLHAIKQENAVLVSQIKSVGKRS